ncbi:unnamed protein product, partial [Discosporangium mesarthrocarpum]
GEWDDRRKAYRRQIMPTSSTGTLLWPDSEGAPAPGGAALGLGSGGRQVPPRAEVTRNLSLLKKKMQGQGGSRRSQSAGHRLSETTK